MKILTSLLLILLFIVIKAFAFEPLFDTRIDYTLSEPANHLVTCDLNGDGCLDVAVAPYYGDSLSILMGNCDGTFQQPVTYGGLDSALSLFAIDLENDGFLDLAIIDIHRISVTIYKNIGNAFQLDASYRVGSRLSSIGCADINNDSYDDIIVADSRASTFTILFNNGSGVFSTRRQIQLIPSIVSIIADDFNNDGIPDIAAVGNPGQTDFTLGILINNGQGQFSDTSLFISDGFYTLKAGDFNGDGFDDIAAIRTTDSVYIYTNNGNGAFQFSGGFPTGREARSIAIGDLNGDGVKDLTVVSHLDSRVLTYFNNGGGTFAVADTYSTPYQPRWVAGGDFNSDGHIDMAVASNGGKAVSVFTNDDTGKFNLPSLYDVSVDPIMVYCANLDGNQLSDLIVKTSDNYLAMLINRSGMNFRRTFITGSPLEDNNIIIGDFNGDSIDDFAIIHHPPVDSLTIRIFFNAGNGNIIGETTINIPNYDSPKYYVSELNGDGIDDIVVGGNSSNFSVILSNQNGSFEPPVQYYINYGFSNPLLVSDLDSDGYNDIIAGADFLTIFRNIGSGVFEEESTFAFHSNSLSKIFGFDFDSDSDNDLIFVNGSSGRIYLLRNNGNMIFTDAGNFKIVGANAPVISADLDHDGRMDIILYLGNYGIAPYLNQGNDTFAIPFRYGTRHYMSHGEGMFAAGDINGDGALDIIEPGYPEFPNKISVMLNKTMVQDVPENPNNNLPYQTSLLINYPNPFNAQTTIRYTLPAASNVSIDIFDITGRKIEMLLSEKQQAGEHSVVWNADGKPSGIYFYRLKAGDISKTEKCILLK
jgi:hypothetical protein